MTGFKSRQKILAVTVILASIEILLLGFIRTSYVNPTGSALTAVPSVAVFPSPLPSITHTPAPTQTPTPSQIPIPPAKLIFGIGSQAGPAMDFRIVKEAPVRMLTSWYNGTGDLEWMRVQQNDLIPRLYRNRYIVHLITWTPENEHDIDTPHGPACGREYPVSAQVIEDMRQLAQIYNGPGPLYVTLFTEFQTYTCTDNSWTGNENYYTTLQDNFRKIRDIFHQYAPNSKVALSWGGWISRYDRSLLPQFADVLRESDFTAYQAMESDTNIQEMLDMTRILGAYKRPVMLAHYKPHSNSQTLFETDMRQFFTDEVIGQLTKNGLFAFSFMDNDLVEGSDASYKIVKNGITKYGK
jgi:hypothetical protein